MPKFKFRRSVYQELVIEAPDATAASEYAENLSSYEWGYENEEFSYRGKAADADTIDQTVDLRGVKHEHEFDDEDTGGCIYCDEPKPVEEVQADE
jgi:hypothetical protein